VTDSSAERLPGAEHRRLTVAVGYAACVLDAVGAPELSLPTPCGGWNLRMLLEHAGDSLAVLHEGLTARRVAACQDTVPAGPGSAAGLVGAFRQRAAALLDASAQADGGPPVAVGGHPLPVDCLRTVGALEIAVHAWDISQSCGKLLPIPDELAADLLVQACLLVPRHGREPLFGAPVPAPARASPGERLTAYLGRSVRRDG
jgi:uncharacterized protein (TIGR03086 family)